MDKSSHSTTSDSKDKRAYSKTYYDLPFDLEEAKKSNVLISGTNSTGKSRLAMALASTLTHNGWKVLAIDNSGCWKEASDLPNYFKVHPQNPFEQRKIVIPSKSMIYDISVLKPSDQRKFIESLLEYVWESRVDSNPSQWCAIVIEEFHLVARSVRYEASEQLLRIMSVGRNIKTRIIGIVCDLALVDPSFVRLSQQRFHARLGIEEGSKRRFRAYYGGDFCRIACELDLGFFLYVLNEKIRITNIPLFEAKLKPLAIQEAKPKSLWQRIREWFR